MLSNTVWMLVSVLALVSAKPAFCNWVTTLLVALSVLFKVPAALAILVISPLWMALTRFKPAAAVLTSELPDMSPAELNAPTKLPLFKLSTIFKVLPASANDTPLPIMVVDANLPKLGSDIKAPTTPMTSPDSTALTTFKPVETSDIPDTPASAAMPPKMSPFLRAIAPFKA